MKPHPSIDLEQSFYLVRSNGNKAHILRGQPPAWSFCGKENPRGEEHLAKWRDIANSRGFCERCLRKVVSEYPHLRWSMR